MASRRKSYTWSAGLIPDVDLFEPAFFGISPREAAQMDPQQRVLLELVWHATEDAGIPASKLAGTATGVYIGGSSTDYRDLRLGDPASGNSYFMTGGTLSILANRISYVFDLRGPSLTIDTACSSSLVALHHACEAIRDGRIDTAIVGGINLLLAPYPFLGFCRASMLSRRGRCFAFDERADGYVRGEGGGVVILKPLARALADGDRVRAVILGTGVNSDGRTIGLSLPSEAAQSALIRTVCERAGVAPDDLAFFEMHGTGTPAGDPIEAAAVGRALGQGRREPLPIGSVKTNIGHLEPASGMAGLIKAALALERGIVPPIAALRDAQPEDPVRRAQSAAGARGRSRSRTGACAGVNSFGFGGTNGHAVLGRRRRVIAPRRRQKPPLRKRSCRRWSSRPVPRPRCATLAERWRDTLAAAPPPRRSARCCAARRAGATTIRSASSRSAPTGPTPSPRLPISPPGSKTPAVVTGTAVRDGKLAFVFAGNGAQWPAWGATPTARAPRSATRSPRRTRRCVPALGWSVGEMVWQRGADAERVGACRHRAAAALRDPGRHRRGAARARDRGGRRISATASARSARPGRPARCRWTTRRGSSSRAAGSRNARAATAAWRRWRWVSRRRASCSPRSAARSKSAR